MCRFRPLCLDIAMNSAVVILVLVIHICSANWAAEWMSPVQQQFDDGLPSRLSEKTATLKEYEDEYEKTMPEIPNLKEVPSQYVNFNEKISSDQPTAGLKMKLENALTNAKVLAEVLKGQIIALSAKENTLKEAITNGRYGVSTVTVETVNQLSRTYIIRDGVWSICTGIIQTPVSQGPVNLFSGFKDAPKCIGREVPTHKDPCVFNSLIKYETVPTTRRSQYIEEDYLCLRNNFNNTLEQYMSVPKRLINETCQNGIIRSLEDNTAECSVRTLSEYNFYPNRRISSPTLPTLPLEYCVEPDGSCKLIVAWHVSNASIENFEFLINEQNFKKYFIKPEALNDDGIQLIK